MANVWRLPIGMPLSLPSGAGTPSTSNLNASTVSTMWAYPSETNSPITRLGIRRNSGIGTIPNYRLSLQGIDPATGYPDGVIKAGGLASVIFAGSALTNAAFNWLTLGASYTPFVGEPLCNVLEYSSGTIDGSNSLTVTTAFTSSAGRTSKYPVAKTGASGVYTSVVGTPCFGYGTAGTVFGFPANVGLTQNINSGAVAEAGAKFAFGTGLTGTYKLKGARFIAGATVAAKALACNIYTGGGASDTTSVQSVTVDTDSLNNTNTGSIDFLFDTGVGTALNFGDTYRVAVSTPDANNEQIAGLSVTADTDWDAFQFGNNFTLSTRSGGNWTDTPTTRLLLELILDDITPAGGSGAPPRVLQPNTWQFVG